MEELKLTIQEAQEMLLMSQSSVYSWIDKGKLQTIEGPSGKLIVISPKEMNQIRELNLKSKRNKTSKQILHSSGTSASLQENSVINAEILQSDSSLTQHISNDSVTLKLITELKELAVEAGKYKQLEIIRNEEKEKEKYWEHKYFEAHAQITAKDLEIAALKKQIEEQKLVIERKKGLFGFLKN